MAVSDLNGPILAIDTGTERLSIGLAGAGLSPLLYEAPGGAAASRDLLPAIHGLFEEAGIGARDLAAVAFGRGPGSFTGLRTACAVAQGLAFGAGLPVLAVDSLLAVAEDRWLREPADSVVALLDARMGEVYAQAWCRAADRWTARSRPVVCSPESLFDALGLGEAEAPGWILAGNAGTALAERLPGAVREAWPAARALLSLAPGLWQAGAAVAADQALPLYVRDKVAFTTAEREAAATARG